MLCGKLKCLDHENSSTLEREELVMRNERENTYDADYNNSEPYLHAIWNLSEKGIEAISCQKCDTNDTSCRDDSEKEHDKNDISFGLSDSLHQGEMQE